MLCLRQRQRLRALTGPSVGRLAPCLRQPFASPGSPEARVLLGGSPQCLRGRLWRYIAHRPKADGSQDTHCPFGQRHNCLNVSKDRGLFGYKKSLSSPCPVHPPKSLIFVKENRHFTKDFCTQAGNYSKCIEYILDYDSLLMFR